MNIFTYRDTDQLNNEGLLGKTGLDCPTYQLEWGDGLNAGITVGSVATVALDSTGATVTSSCISTTTNSGSLTTVTMKTCGSGGTGAATDGARFRLRTTATLSAGTLIFDVFVYVRNKTYAPS